MTALQDLQDVLVDTLRDLLDAEKRLTKALPRMAKAASREELAEAFWEHADVTEQHVERLQEVFELLGMRTRGKHCPAMEGLIEEAKEHLAERHESDPDALDAALIVAAQKVEHYEIAAYGSARSFAARMGHDRVAELLQQTLDEEGETDKRLTRIAERLINPDAAVEAESKPNPAESVARERGEAQAQRGRASHGRSEGRGGTEMDREEFIGSTHRAAPEEGEAFHGSTEGEARGRSAVVARRESRGSRFDFEEFD